MTETAMRMPKENGTSNVSTPAGDKDVPAWKPAPNQSVDQAAAALGFRVLERRERGKRDDVVGAICDGGATYPCVKK